MATEVCAMYNVFVGGVVKLGFLYFGQYLLLLAMISAMFRLEKRLAPLLTETWQCFT